MNDAGFSKYIVEEAVLGCIERIGWQGSHGSNIVVGESGVVRFMDTMV